MRSQGRCLRSSPGRLRAFSSLRAASAAASTLPGIEGGLARTCQRSADEVLAIAERGRSLERVHLRSRRHSDRFVRHLHSYISWAGQTLHSSVDVILGADVKADSPLAPALILAE